MPREKISQDYDLEYSSATLQMHSDSIKRGQKVIIIDDLIATGGTIDAIVKMVRNLGGNVVGVYCLIELIDLKARENLDGITVKSCVTYKGE